jgi:hypothetical protein
MSKWQNEYEQIAAYIQIILSKKTCSLQQPLGLPAANPAYPLTCSNPFAGFKFFTFQNNKHQNPKA